MRFLATLVERHRADHAASVPRLEPRIPSRFEPVAHAAEPAPGARDVVIDVVRDAELATPRGRRQASRPSGADADRFEDPDPHVRTLASALTAARATVAVPVLTPPGPPVSPAARGVDTPPTPAPRTMRAETRDEIPAIGPPPERPRRPSLEPRPERRPVPSVSTAVRADRERMAPPEPPTVHVSIGRVDVRAIVAPPAASPARPPSSTNRLSLEEYLRGRQRGPR
jgi:hypothetical protein